jgi:hypothetical protein
MMISWFVIRLEALY